MLCYVSKMGLCRELLTTMEILPYYSLCIFTIIVCDEQQTFIYKELKNT